MCVKMIGLQNLTNGYGLIIFVQGLACLVGVPIGQQLVAFSGKYEFPFFYAGFVIIFGAILLVLIKPIAHCELKQKQASWVQIV